MDLTPYRHTETVTIACSPEEAYAVVADITRMGELSPVCSGGEWEGDGSGNAGDWFVGHNGIGEFTWDTRCQVDVAEPGKEFTFTNHGADGTSALVRWSYTFEPAGEGTAVSEHWEVLPAYPDFVLAGDPNADVAARIDAMAGMAKDGMAATLASLKRVVEG